MGFIINPFRFVPAGETWEMPYDNTTGWTLPSNPTITGGSMVYTSTLTNPVTAHFEVPFVLSDTLWYCDYDIASMGGNAVDQYHIWHCGFAAGTASMPNNTQDSIAAATVMNNSNFQFELFGRDGGTDYSAQSGVNTAYGAFYPRLARTSATGNLFQGFTNSERTSGGTELTDTIPSTIDTLTHLHHDTAAFNSSQNLSMNIPNLVLYNGMSP
tara:strand:- start:500 stop:1138 length:639 start_codon:yes stop_codon:yes gene_type:complete